MEASPYEPDGPIYDPVFPQVAKKVRERNSSEGASEAVQTSSHVEYDGLLAMLSDFSETMRAIFKDLLGVRSIGDYDAIVSACGGAKRRLYLGVFLVLVGMLYLFCTL